MITASQALLSVIIIFIIFRTYAAYKKNNLSISFLFIWIAFWLAILILIAQQNLVSTVAHKLGISRGVDMVIYISLIVVFYLIYKIFVVVQEIESKITNLVRQVALKDVKKK